MSAEEVHPRQEKPYEVLVVASSAGGVSALSHLVSRLPENFAVPVLIVQHLDPRHDTVLAQVLSRRTSLGVTLAHGQEMPEAGVVYIAPPDHHLLVGADGRLALSSSELVHFVRPSADLLFESVAGAYGDRVIACVLTGSGTDGAMGVTAVHSRGGTVVVEDPATAMFTGMPNAAVATGDVDFVLPLAEIPEAVCHLVEARRN
jgi:two-component system chemotaxis response regulator CheB